MARVSVLLPTYNQAQFLPAALAGLDAQTFRDFELLACDDGSTDATPYILRAANIRAFRHDVNQGTAAAINTASAQATGEFWTWVSSDNVMTTDWLETLVGVLDRNPKAGFVYSGFWYETGTNKPIVLHRQYHPDALIGDENCLIGPSFLIRSEVWKAAGPHTGRISHDLGHWLRIEEICNARGLQIISLSTPLCHYRVHPGMAGRVRRHEYDAPLHHAEARARRRLSLV